MLLTVCAGIVSFIVRDRTIAFALLTYIPLLPVGLATIVLDIVTRGRPWSRPQYLASAIGIGAAAMGGFPLLGSAPANTTLGPDSRVIHVLHWNVMWGGGPGLSPRTWASQRSTILANKPDIVMLSESPQLLWIDQLLEQLGPEWTLARAGNEPRDAYWYQLTILARGTVRIERTVPFPNGVGLDVSVKIGDQSLRVLAVDGRSNPLQSRLPLLKTLSRYCEGEAELGRPVDIIGGDFNTPSRSLGFDALSEQGFRLASRSTSGWRGTFPSYLPVYDIDHVWVAKKNWRVHSCDLFNGPYSDHRGQLVNIVPEADPRPSIIKSSASAARATR